MRLFKHTLLALTAILAFAAIFSACDKLDGLLSVNAPLSADGITFTIPVDAHLDDTTVFSYSIKIDSLINAASTQLSASNIKSLEIDTVTITSTDPNLSLSNNFNNIETASVAFTSSYLPSDTTTIATLPTTTVSSSIVSSLVLPVNNTVDLSHYLDLTNTTTTSTNLSFILRTHLRTAISAPLNCTANVHFIVRAGL